MDIYFNKQYGELCKYIEKGECQTFKLDTINGSISNMFIKRRIPMLVDGVQYYDIITPYGYGGPIILESNDLRALVDEYEREFSAFCAENRIVCEFVRYHPIYRNWEPVKDIYLNVYSRHTVGTNLMDYDDPIQSEFSKSARREIKQAISNGITCTVNEHPQDLSVFRKLYEQTLDRNKAEGMYYFPKQYYDELEIHLSKYIMEVQAHLNGEIIASEIYFIKDRFIHAHLLGSNETCLKLSGGALIEATAAKWGKEKGYQYIHHGGGRTSSEEDPLFRYKKKFGKHTQFDFYIGKKVWNKEVYNYLVEKRKEKGEILNQDYFPQYRSE